MRFIIRTWPHLIVGAGLSKLLLLFGAGPEVSRQAGRKDG